MSALDEAARHLDALARAPRPAGSTAEAAARAYCRAELQGAGFDVHEELFTYSAFPGRWATPLAGAALAGTFMIAGHAAFRGHATATLASLLVIPGVVAVLGRWFARTGILRFPALRRSGVNLVATRGTPAVWLVAHLDSKSQPVPIALRATGVMATAILWLVALAVAGVQLAGLPVASWWPYLATVGIVATVPVVASVVGASSPGALDDASGVCAVLLAAARPADDPLGVLLTSAEELGLAGARAWAASRSAGVAINCDGVDDAGRTTCMYTAPAPARLLDAARAAGGSVAAPVIRRLLPGVLVDAVALADAKWETITLSRGNWRTLARIHTARDTRDALRGEGIVAVAELMGRMTDALRTSETH